MRHKVVFHMYQYIGIMQKWKILLCNGQDVQGHVPNSPQIKKNGVLCLDGGEEKFIVIYK